MAEYEGIACWVRSRKTRVEIRLNRGSDWELKGSPSDSPQNGDKVLNSQIQYLKILEAYGLTQEAKISRYEFLICFFMRILRLHWKQWGVFQNGKAVRLG